MSSSSNVHKGNYIAGRWVDADLESRIEVVNPANESVIATVPDSGLSTVDSAVNAATRAFQSWASLAPKQRAAIMFELADRLEADVATMSQLEAANSGHPISTVPGEVKSAADRLRFFGGAARLLEGQSSGEYQPGYTSIIRREPIGVAGLITPWNYPLLTAITKLAPAIAAGNTAVLKPSEQTPLTTLRFAELCEGVLPEGVLNVITGYGHTVGAAMASHRGVDIVSLTGGTDTGKRVAQLAADSLKHVHLELGGKAPAIVLDDANPVHVAQSLRAASFWNAGQDCSAAVRVLVTESAYEGLVEALCKEVSTLNVGDPLNQDVEMGPLTYAAHRDNVLGYLDRAVNSGAEILHGGGSSRKGYFVDPTVLTHVGQESEIVQREVFGPVVTIQRVRDYAQAVQFANDVDYGLGASIFTRDVAAAMNAARELKFGTVWVNDHGAVTAEMPWGGYKQSGYGKERSKYSLEDYTQIKHVMVSLS